MLEQLRLQRQRLAEAVDPTVVDLPLGAIQVFLHCWTELFGVIALESYSHLSCCLDDVTPFFEATLADVVGRVTGPVPLGEGSVGPA
jgi:hypothetical protein